MKSVFQEQFKLHKIQLDNFIHTFDNSGNQFGDADRNTIKLFKLNVLTLNVKSFKVPNIFNQFAYKFLRKGKAQRSFEYANMLKQMAIGTPNPIAYYEFTKSFLFKKSFYISEHLDCDLTYRELTINLNYPNHEEILRAFTRFTYHLHNNNINFLDHSPGNTLIKKLDNDYSFFLVDLNRMEFKPMNFESRINNFSRLTIHKTMVEVMSDEYAKCSGEDYNKVFALMWQSTEAFQERYKRKRSIKDMLLFWRVSK
jgi:hypothetical protein